MMGALNYRVLGQKLRHTLYTMVLTIIECERYHTEVARAHLVMENLKRSFLELPLFFSYSRE